jgi:hypothetical protein
MPRQIKGNTLISDDGTVAVLEATNGPYIQVDTADLPLLSQYSWYVTVKGYVSTNTGQPRGHDLKLHHLLYPSCPVGLVRDHKDRDKLNNTRGNIHFISQRGNNLNKEKQQAARYIGVSIDSSGKTYRFRFGKHSFKVDGRKELKGFLTELDAAIAYDQYVFGRNALEQTNYSLGKYTNEDLRLLGVSSFLSYKPKRM